jgi:hypothetical protein
MLRFPRGRGEARRGPLATIAYLLGMLLGMIMVVALLAAPGGSASADASARAALQSRIEFGAFVAGMTNDPAKLAQFERRVRSQVDIASYFWGYGDIFPTERELAFADGGRRKVLLSWDMGPTRFSEWTAGEHDHYLDEIVARARAYPYDVYVRPWPEMNGDWQSFQPTAAGEKVHGGTHAEFQEAWRYLVTYFRSRGVDNLKWVFNPTADTYAETTDVRRIWPGAEYVDVLGLDGYNWGRDSSWGRWTSFTTIFAEQYDRLTGLHPSAPVWICEVSSKEPRRHDGAPKDADHSKARWIREAMRSTAFPRLTAVVWFNELKERDWRVDSSRGSLRAMRRSLR